MGLPGGEMLLARGAKLQVNKDHFVESRWMRQGFVCSAQASLQVSVPTSRENGKYSEGRRCLQVQHDGIAMMLQQSAHRMTFE